MATSKINNPMAWKLKDTASGNATVAMPTDYNEILLAATCKTYNYFAIVPKSEVSASTIYPRFASYYNSNTNSGGYFEVNSSTAKIGNFVENGGNSIITQATFKLYYR